MADRFFANVMPDFIVEEEEEEEEEEDGDPKETKMEKLEKKNEGVVSASLKRLLFLPYEITAQEFMRAGMEITDTIVEKTWLETRGSVKDFSLYTGSLGTAFLLLKAYEATRNKDCLTKCLEILTACESASCRMREDVTFICGQAGVFALGAVAAKLNGDQPLVARYLSLFKKIAGKMDILDVPYELLYGRSGYLWACSYLNKHLGSGTIPSTITGPLVKEIIHEGRRLSQPGGSPLMYSWHGKRYWGAAHGLAGIMHVLMDMDLGPKEQEDIRGTLEYMTQNRFPSGNYPSSEGSSNDRLVHWCHGAPGVALTLCKAARVFDSDEFTEAAIDAGELVWRRGLLKRLGICHGVSGNSYVFLALYRLTGRSVYLYKAKAFASFLLDQAPSLIARGAMHGGDHPYSLFEGYGGTTHLFLDMVRPLEARFPGYEL